MDQRKLRALACVRRFNFERCNRYETVAEHSLFVAMLAAEAALVLGRKPGPFVLEAVLHDAEEAATGDIPYLTRAALGAKAVAELEGIASRELGVDTIRAAGDTSDLVAYCDALELAMYLREEMSSGNKTLVAIYSETVNRLRESALWSALKAWTVDLLTPGEDDTPSGPFLGLKH